MAKKNLKTTPYVPADYLKTEEEMAAYMEAALEDGNPAVVAMAAGNIARARGMTKVAKDAGLSRATMYKNFKEGE